MAIAVVLILLVVGSLLFHFLSPWWFTPIASNWGTMDTTVNITFWVTGAVFVAVNLFLAWAIWRYRHRPGQRAKYEPESKKLEWWLTVVTTIGVVAMLTPGLFVWAEFVNVPKDAALVEAVGQQWNWSYRFPGPDGVLGESSTRLTTASNPFGIDPQDPKGQDDILVANPELHLPVGQPVKILLRSNDVLHDFTVPQFRVKMDLVPGMVTHLWLTPTQTGSYDILCEELCGLAHFAMRGRVVVDEQEQFDAWLATQPKFAMANAAPAGDPAAGQAAYAPCLACHGANGEGNAVLNAPRLAGLESWYLERQLHNFRSGIRGANAGDTYGAQMVAFASLLDETATRNVAAYLDTLPEQQRPETTVAGDAERGRELYATCAGCHGADGQGVWTTQAPRLAAMADWYVVRQLNNFRQGIRGAHPQDFRGAQMALMARVPRDDRAVADLAAYIQTLKPPQRMAAAASAP
jgi:cytochrome c oxidase subunit 2